MKRRKTVGQFLDEFLRDYFDIEGDRSFKYVLIVFGGLAILNTATAFINENEYQPFIVSSSQWWGSFTSLGLYDSIGSIVGLLFLIFLFASVNSRLKPKKRELRSLLFSVCPLASAIIVNYVWAFLTRSVGGTTYGSSGVSMAADGFLVIISLFNLVQTFTPEANQITQIRLINRNEREFWIVMNLFVFFGMIAFPLILQPVYKPAPHINTLIHEINLLIGLLAGLVYTELEIFYFRRGRRSAAQLEKAQGR